jgi:hypothetical protein
MPYVTQSIGDARYGVRFIAYVELDMSPSFVIKGEIMFLYLNVLVTLKRNQRAEVGKIWRI